MQQAFNKFILYAFVVAGILFLFWGCTPNKDRVEPSSKTLGWLEKVYIQEANLFLEAKLDTGATTSSIDAKIIEVLEPTEDESESSSAKTQKASKKTVGSIGQKKTASGQEPTKKTIVFQIKDRRGGKQVLKKELSRIVKIKRKGGSSLKRYVVRMKLCIAGKDLEGEVTLANRDNFSYPVLIGRNMLSSGEIAVDSSQKFIAKAGCGLEVNE